MPLPGGMSGEAAAQALRARFEEIRKSELQRLARKIAALEPQDRLQVDAITLGVVHALVSKPANALVDSDDPRLVDAVVGLFGVAS